MQAFLQSAFLQALSYGLIASIWQMGLIWLVTVTLLKLKLSSAQKFNLAFIAQLTGFALFICTCIHAYYTGTGKISIATHAQLALKLNTILAAIIPYTAIIYLCLLLINLGKLIFVYGDARAFKNHELHKISPELRIFVEQMSELFSLRRKVKIYLSEKIFCPLTTGFLKPVILIPFASVNHLTTKQMEAVILHELAHIKRSDYLLYIIQCIIDKIFFFNVFSGMLSNIIEREREIACDDWVLQFRYNSMHYAEALFKLGRLKALPAFAMHFSGKKESLLLIRVKRLLHHTQSRTDHSFQSLLPAICSVVVMAALLISFTIQQPNQVNKSFATVSAKPLKRIETARTTTIAYTIPQFKTREIKPERKTVVKNKAVHAATIETAAHKPQSGIKLLQQQQQAVELNQQYVLQVKQSIDSLQQILPKYQQALNSNLVVTPEAVQKAISYRNFKQIENMLAATGNSVTVKENETSKNSYKKEITIESKDKDGNSHVYNVIVELYQ